MRKKVEELKSETVEEFIKFANAHNLYMTKGN